MVGETSVLSFSPAQFSRSQLKAKQQDACRTRRDNVDLYKRGNRRKAQEKIVQPPDRNCNAENHAGRINITTPERLPIKHAGKGADCYQWNDRPPITRRIMELRAQSEQRCNSSDERCPASCHRLPGIARIENRTPPPQRRIRTSDRVKTVERQH